MNNFNKYSCSSTIIDIFNTYTYSNIQVDWEGPGKHVSSTQSMSKIILMRWILNYNVK